MFLPIGFGGRFPRFPWVTTLLCLAGIFPIVVSPSLQADGPYLGGNLLLLFLVGCLVECRRSPWILIGTFFACAGLGFFLHTFLRGAAKPSHLVAASSGIAAVAGLFTAYFFRFRMKFMFFVVPPFYKKFHVSSLVILPLTFYVSDFLSSISSGIEAGATHAAHLGGSVIGLAVGFSIEKLRPIRWPLLYASEEAELQAITEEPNPYQRIHRSLDLLRVNPENMLAAEIVCKETLRLISQGFPVTPEFHELLRQYVPTLMSVHLRMKNPERAFALLPRIPTQIVFPSILDRSCQAVVVAGMKWAQDRGDLWTLLRLYETWIKRFASNPLKDSVNKDLHRILSALEPSAETYRHLSLLYHTDPSGPLAPQYQQHLLEMYRTLSEDRSGKKAA